MSSHVAWPLAYNVIRGRSESNTFGLVRHHGDGTKKAHQGWDFEAGVGTPIYAIADGKIVFVKSNVGDYGSQVCMSFDFNGKTLYAYYAHLSSMSVKDGDSVSQGDSIGATGKTGNAKNLAAKEDHLHFEIREKANCGLGLAGRISPLKVYGVCPLKEPAYQNFSRFLPLSANEMRCMR